MTPEPSTARKLHDEAPAAVPALGPGSADTLDKHRELIRAVRHRQRVRDCLAAALGGFGAMVLLVTAAGAVAGQYPRVGRIVLLAGLPLIAALVAWALARAYSRLRKDVQVARFLNRQSPVLARQILGAVELGSELERARFSRELTTAYIRTVDQSAASTEIGPLIDGSKTRLAVLIGIGATAIFGFTLIFNGADWLKGIAAAARSSSASKAAPIREPITGDIELLYHYPAYTGLVPRTVSGTSGEISAPVGTEVEIRTRADRPIDRAEIAYAGIPVPLQVSNQRDLTGRMLVDKSGAYHFVFLKGNGRVVAIGPDIPVQADPDNPPKVSILSPGEELEVDKNQKVVVKYEASDDYGITALELVYQLPRSPEQRLPLKPDEGRKVSGQFTWDVGTLRLQPGERVSYYLEVRDNNEFEGKKKGVSRTQVLKLYSAAEHRREAASRVEALWEKLVGLLGSRLEGPEKAKPPDPEKIIAQQSLDQSALELAADLSTLASDLSQERDTPPELWSAAANIADSLAKKARATSDFRRAFIRYQRQGFTSTIGRQLNQAIREEIQEEEKDVLYLEVLLDRQKVEQLRELGKQLNADRRELASLIEQFKKSQGEQARENVMSQIRQLRARIDEILQRMADLAKGIRDEHLNAEALASMMKDEDFGSALDEIEKLMREGKSDEALAKLQELGMQMENMMNRLEQSGDQLAENANPELAAKFQQLMEKLEKTTRAQQQLADETKAIRDRYKNKLRAELKQKGDALRQRLAKEAEAIAREYQQISNQEISPRGVDHSLEAVQAELENVKNALKVDDFSLAADSASRAERHAEDLRIASEQQRQLDEIFQNPQEMRAHSKRFSERVSQSSDRVKELNRKLQQLFPPPGSMLSEADRQQLKPMAGSQRQLEKDARELQQKMEEISQMAPIFGPESSQQMGQVVERMGDAAQRMEVRDPGKGYGEQRTALEQLHQLQEQMKQAESQAGKGFPLPMMRRAGGQLARRQKVEIPDPDQFQAPKEFRKDLLDAMKQRAPEKYKDQVKRYYEELVK